MPYSRAPLNLLSQGEVREGEFIGMLARYHRHGAPTTDDYFYALLDQPDHLRLRKLASLLRVADALENA